MAYILHIDTSGDSGKLILSLNGKLISERTNNDTRNHAAVINNLIEELVKEADIRLKDLSAIAVCGGPGSYTGLRIGLSTAKALCYTLDIPLLHQDRLILLALAHIYNKLSSCHKYVTILPAREKEYFIGIYSDDLSNIYGPKHIFEDELSDVFDKAGKCAVLTGKNIDESVMSKFSFEKTEEVNEIDAISWAKYAYDAYVDKNFANVALTEPYYLKQVYTHK